MKKNYRLIFATIISLSLINCGGSENVTNEENTEQKVQTAAPFEKKPQTVIIPNTNVSINNDSSAHVVTVVETQSGSTVGSFTMPGGSVEFLEKQYAYCVFSASANVRGTKVGFTQ